MKSPVETVLISAASRLREHGENELSRVIRRMARRVALEYHPVIFDAKLSRIFEDYGDFQDKEGVISYIEDVFFEIGGTNIKFDRDYIANLPETIEISETIFEKIDTLMGKEDWDLLKTRAIDCEKDIFKNREKTLGFYKKNFSVKGVFYDYYAYTELSGTRVLRISALKRIDKMPSVFSQLTFDHDFEILLRDIVSKYLMS